MKVFLKVVLWLFIIGVQENSLVSTNPLKTEAKLTGNECFNHNYNDRIPYPGDCTRYLVCEFFSGTVMPCPGGLHFNPVMKDCSSPSTAGCNSEGATIPTKPPTTPETVPTLGPDGKLCNGKKNGVLLSYPYDCEWYIRCEDDTSVVIRCEKGREFNALLQICDYPEYAQCVATPYPNTPTSTTPITDSTGSSTTEVFTVTTIISTSTTETSMNSPTTPEKTPTLRPEDNKCYGKANGVLLSYAYDCEWYIRCEDYNSILLPCEKGRQFNQLLQICDYPEYAQCIATPYPTTAETSSTSPITTSSTSESTESPVISTSTTNSPTTPEIVPTLDPKDTRCNGKAVGTLISYPYDCNWYIRCEDHSSKLLPCKEGRQFNELFQICDYPEYAQCIATPYPTTASSTTPIPSSPTCESTTETPTTTPITTSFTTESPATDTSPISSSPTSESTNSPTTTTSSGKYPTLRPEDNLCNGRADGTLLPYPYNCDWYIRCEDDASTLRRCKNGRQFNSDLLVCDYPENAQCIATPYPTRPTEPTTEPTTESPIPTKPSPSGSNICCGVENGTLVAYPEDCTQYIKCIYPIPVALQCEKDLHYNVISQACEAVESAKCQWYKPITCEDKEDGTVFPYKENCKQYYYCSNGEKVLLPCTVGSVFDPTVGNCVPGNVCP